LHDGYKIAAEAQVMRVGNANPKAWEDIIGKARSIPNISDRSFVIAIIGAAMPSRLSERRIQCCEEALEIAENIPSFFDRVDRLSDISSVFMYVEPSIAKKCLNLAMEIIGKRDSTGYRNIQKRIIDMSYKIDPNLAASLASLADDDPARGNARQELKERIGMLQLKSKIASDMPSGDSLSTKYQNEFPRAAWMVLGSLNAGRVNTIHIERTREIIRIAASLPLRRAYPIIAWVIENAVRRLANTDQAKVILRELFEGTLISAEIAARTGSRLSNQIQRLKRQISKEEEGESFLIRAGERERGITYLRDWFETQVKDYIKICDQYFSPDDLELILKLGPAKRRCKYYILTGKTQHDKLGILSPDIAYLEQWRRISDQDPPEIEIIIVGVEPSGKSPIHDRWWLTNGGGLLIGTSFNSLGKTQDSTITRISENKAKLLEEEIDEYVINRKREYKGERIRYLSFTI
jgi:hypothetical protein